MPRTGYNGYSAKLKRNYATIEISLGLYTCWVPPSSSFPFLPHSPLLATPRPLLFLTHSGKFRLPVKLLPFVANIF